MQHNAGQEMILKRIGSIMLLFSGWVMCAALILSYISNAISLPNIRQRHDVVILTICDRGSTVAKLYQYKEDRVFEVYFGSGKTLYELDAGEDGVHFFSNAVDFKNHVRISRRTWEAHLRQNSANLFQNMRGNPADSDCIVKLIRSDDVTNE